MRVLKRGLVGAAVAGVAFGAVVGLASPAMAETLDGSYVATVTHSGGPLPNGATETWLVTPCGPDCLRLETNPPNANVFELHPAGATWAGTMTYKTLTCTVSIDSAALTATRSCGSIELGSTFALARS